MFTNTKTPASERATNCCECCSDCRHAVIIVDLVIIALEGLAFILLATNSNTSYFAMDQDTNLIRTEMIFSAISIMAEIISNYGTYIFNISPVFLNMAWLLVGFIAGIVIYVQWCEDCNY